MPYRVKAAAILVDWRRVERQHLVAPADSEESEHLAAELARLRNEYIDTIHRAESNHMPVPPPFPPDAN